jgi:hypothetical protein
MSYIVDNRPKIDFFTASDARATSECHRDQMIGGAIPRDTEGEELPEFRNWNWRSPQMSAHKLIRLD